MKGRKPKHHFAINSPEFKIGDFVTNGKRKNVWRLTSLSNGHDLPYPVYARACRKKKDGSFCVERFLYNGPYYKVIFPLDLLSEKSREVWDKLIAMQ